MSLEQEEDLLYYEKELRKQMSKEAQQEHDNLAGRKLRLVSFESRSRGKNKNKLKRSREVNLLVDYSAVKGPIAYIVKSGEIQSRKSPYCLTPDQLAMNTLTDLPPHMRTADVLLERLLTIRSRNT